MQVVSETDLKVIPFENRDSVRDIYKLPNDKQLIIHTDRAHVDGVKLPVPLPYRGVMINQISMYWMNRFTHLIGNNIVAHNVEKFPVELQAHRLLLANRSVVAQKLKPLPLHCRVFGNLIGEAWKEYQRTGLLGGRRGPKGLQEADLLERPYLQLKVGGNLGSQVENAEKWAQRMLGMKIFSDVSDACLAIFGVARNYAAARGMIVPEAFFEFGLDSGKVYLVNDVLSPLSATYWSAEDFTPGGPQPDLENKELHAWLVAQGWNRNNSMPDIPKEILEQRAKKCRWAFEIMTGRVESIKKQEEREEAERAAQRTA